MKQGNAHFCMYCFGGFRILAGNQNSIDFGSSKAKALLIYLSIEFPQSFLRSHLAGLLWSDCSESKALHNLRQTLYQLRNAWSQAGHQIPLFDFSQDSIALNPHLKIWVDVNVFEQAYELAFKFLDNHLRLDRIDIHNLKNVVAMYQGPFLDRFRLDNTLIFDEWASFLRERTNRLALEGLSYLCTYYERRGDLFEALKLADRIVTITPWDEHAYARSMRLSAMRKEWGSASQKYRQLVKYLRENLSIEPEPSITILHQEIRALATKDQSLPAKLLPVENRIPKPSTSFVGRQQELADLAHMLADPGIRLVSLIGMGGIGKSRLAIEIGHQLYGLYQHGVFFISLKDVNSSEQMIHQVEESFAIRFSENLSFREQILGFLKSKQCLIIIDSFEHCSLKDQAGHFLSRLLEEAPDVKVLVTSRERLNFYEENAYVLSGLSYQHRVDATNATSVVSDVVTLFQERVKQIDPQISFNENTLRNIERLCDLVEGHPLSIELMVSATKNLSLEDLVLDMESNLLTLDSHFINSPAEQRNLSVVLERSWRYLTEEERRVMCHLAIFKGGFSERASVMIAHATKPQLSALVDQSWVRTSDFHRYDLHEVIAQFSKQKSVGYQLGETVRESHANFFISELIKTSNLFWHGDQREALKKIRTDIDNILTAWQYMIEKRRIGDLESCIDIIHQFYVIRGPFSRGLNIFEEALKVAQGLGSGDLLVGKFSNRLGSFAHKLFKNELAYEMYTNAFQIFNLTKNKLELGFSQLGLSQYYLRIKNLEKALEFSLRALTCFEDAGKLNYQAKALNLLGLIHLRSAHFKDAKVMFERSLSLSEEVCDERCKFLALNQLAGIDCNDGDFISAKKRYLQSLALARSFKDRFNEAIVLNNLASVYHPRKNYEKEVEVLQESLKICREIGDQEGVAIALNNLAELAMVQGNYQQAIDYSNQALEIATDISEDWTIIAINDILGESYLGLGEFDRAYQYFVRAIQIAYKIKSWDLLTRSIVNVAVLFKKIDDLDKAKDLLQAALSHPGILYEYGLKATALLSELGEEIHHERQPELLWAVLDHYFDLFPTDQ